MPTHRDLKVWQLSNALAVRIHELTRGVSVESGADLVDQVRRASLSVGANIAEGRGLRTNAQFRRHLDIALGSAAETDAHLAALLDRDVLSARDVFDLRDQLATIQRMLVALRNSLPAAPTRASEASRPPTPSGAATASPRSTRTSASAASRFPKR
jgi:four helix bundle protein